MLTKMMAQELGPHKVSHTHAHTHAHTCTHHTCTRTNPAGRPCLSSLHSAWVL